MTTIKSTDTSPCTAIRILRAIEGEGENQVTEDFEVWNTFQEHNARMWSSLMTVKVPAFLLGVSEALEPMSGNGDVMISNDDVVMNIISFSDKVR